MGDERQWKKTERRKREQNPTLAPLISIKIIYIFLFYLFIIREPTPAGTNPRLERREERKEQGSEKMEEKKDRG